MWLYPARFFHAGPSSLAFLAGCLSRIVIYRAKSRRSGLEWGDLRILFNSNNCSLSVDAFSFSLIWESIAAQFLTFVPHGEQTLVEKDSPSSRTTKSSFFSRSAHFGNVSPFLVGATNTFSELIHPLIKLSNCVLKFYNYPKRSSLSAYSPFEEQAQALLAYCHFHSFLILHILRQSIAECIKFTKSCDQIFDSSTTFLNPLVETNSLYGKRTVGFFSLASHALRAC